MDPRGAQIMKRLILTIAILTLVAAVAYPQKRKTVRTPVNPTASGSAAIVIDERLAVLRAEPGLYQPSIGRLKLGTRLNIFEEKKADGVSFYKVADRRAVTGWIQSNSLTGSFLKREDIRIIKLIQASEGVTKIHRAAIFLEVFPDSKLRPSILLLFGDLVERNVAEISARAKAELKQREMAAAGAPIHSFYLNYHELDPYISLGIRIFFDEQTNMLHYSGDSWFEITKRFPESSESIEARERKQQNFLDGMERVQFYIDQRQFVMAIKRFAVLQRQDRSLVMPENMMTTIIKECDQNPATRELAIPLMQDYLKHYVRLKVPITLMLARHRICVQARPKKGAELIRSIQSEKLNEREKVWARKLLSNANELLRAGTLEVDES